MSNSFDSHSCTIATLLGESERRGIILPRFQRGFSWENSHVERFWADLIDFKGAYDLKPISASYFLGPIVLLPQEEELILLDGQQRLATSTILLSCIRDLAREINTMEPTKHLGTDLARDIQTKFIQKGDSEPIRHALRLGELDEGFFIQAIINDIANIVTPTLKSHNLIRAARNLLLTNLTVLTRELSIEQSIKLLRGIKDCLTQGMTMVAIEVKSEEDAFTIFETLNDRGLRLSVPDLLLNLLMRRASTDPERDSVRQKWNYMLQQIGKRDIARFLRHMWLSKYGDLKSRGLFAEIKEHLQTKDIDSLSFADASSNECDFYISILDIDSEIPKDAREAVEGIVRNLSVTAAFPLLLSGLACLNESDFRKLAESVVGIIVRHSVFANQNPAILESAFYEAAREMRSKHSMRENSSRCLASAKSIIIKINPSDAAILENGKDIDLSRQQATWIIKNLAKAKQGTTKEIGFEKANLEHIFPENAGAEWPNRKELTPYLWRIGNLAHLGNRLNRNAKNSSFIDKCNNYYNKSEIIMTKEITKYTQWTEAELKMRTDEMLKYIVRLWPGK
jgi:uncharacterized protein with ParB-like and HNH nuclease domain